MPALVVDYLEWLPTLAKGRDPTASLRDLLCDHGVHLRAPGADSFKYDSCYNVCCICDDDITLFYGFVDVRGRLVDPNAHRVVEHKTRWLRLPSRLGLVCHFCLPLHAFQTVPDLVVTPPPPTSASNPLSVPIEAKQILSGGGSDGGGGSDETKLSRVGLVFVNRFKWCNDMTGDYCKRGRDHSDASTSRTLNVAYPGVQRGHILSFHSAHFQTVEWRGLRDGQIDLEDCHDNDHDDHSDSEGDARLKILGYTCALCGGYTKRYVLLNKFDGEDDTHGERDLEIEACVVFCDECADSDRTGLTAVKREHTTYKIDVSYRSHDDDSDILLKPSKISEQTTHALNRQRLLDLVALKYD